MAPNEISRRKIIGVVGTGVIGLGALGLGGRVVYEKLQPEFIPAYAQQDFPPDSGLLPPSKEALYDMNHDPLFRAANVTVTIGVSGYAHASLIDTGNDLILSTAEHVATAAKDSVISVAQIPGVGAAPLAPERFIFGNKHDKEWETSAFYIFGENSKATIRQAVADKKISPLRLQNGMPGRDEVVAIPRGEHGTYSFYQFIYYHPTENLLELQGFSENCLGDSGSPILQIEDMNNTIEVIPTGVSYGCLEGVYDSWTDPEGNECSSTILARPNG